MIFRQNQSLSVDETLIEDNFSESCELQNLRNKNPFRVIIGHININSIRNKFESLMKLVNKNLDILMISETKIDDTFPESQFLIEGFSAPYRLDRTGLTAQLKVEGSYYIFEKTYRLN